MIFKGRLYDSMTERSFRGLPVASVLYLLCCLSFHYYVVFFHFPTKNKVKVEVENILLKNLIFLLHTTCAMLKIITFFLTRKNLINFHWTRTTT